MKYQRFTPSAYKDIGIRKVEFVAKTQFLSAVSTGASIDHNVAANSNDGNSNVYDGRSQNKKLFLKKMKNNKIVNKNLILKTGIYLYVF